jgi:flagellar assembly protein FliH
LPFPYNEAVASPGQRNFPLPEHRVAGWGESDPSASAARGAEREAQVRELGRQQGGAECRARFEEQLAGERVALAQALKDFARERATYYQKLEEEAVRLAMSIARKVLHREAQVDPLLLMGIVRVALERIEGATGVALLVHPERAPDWRRYLASRMDPGDLPEIVEDAAMRLEQCVLRTSMGTADLGLEAQLKEIEQGLMDLLAARPQEKR